MKFCCNRIVSSDGMVEVGYLTTDNSALSWSNSADNTAQLSFPSDSALYDDSDTNGHILTIETAGGAHMFRFDDQVNFSSIKDSFNVQQRNKLNSQLDILLSLDDIMASAQRQLDEEKDSTDIITEKPRSKLFDATITSSSRQAAIVRRSNATIGGFGPKFHSSRQPGTIDLSSTLNGHEMPESVLRIPTSANVPKPTSAHISSKKRSDSNSSSKIGNNKAVVERSDSSRRGSEWESFDIDYEIARSALPDEPYAEAVFDNVAEDLDHYRGELLTIESSLGKKHENHSIITSDKRTSRNGQLTGKTSMPSHLHTMNRGLTSTARSSDLGKRTSRLLVKKNETVDSKNPVTGFDSNTLFPAKGQAASAGDETEGITFHVASSNFSSDLANRSTASLMGNTGLNNTSMKLFPLPTFQDPTDPPSTENPLLLPIGGTLTHASMTRALGITEHRSAGKYLASEALIDGFMISPAKILFENYSSGETHTISIRVQNLTTVRRVFRLFPPRNGTVFSLSSSEDRDNQIAKKHMEASIKDDSQLDHSLTGQADFELSGSSLKADHNQPYGSTSTSVAIDRLNPKVVSKYLAPGIACVLSLTFSVPPSIPTDFQDALLLETDSGRSSIPVNCVIQPPELTLPREISLSACPPSTSSEMVLTVRNPTRGARFRIFSSVLGTDVSDPPYQCPQHSFSRNGELSPMGDSSPRPTEVDISTVDSPSSPTEDSPRAGFGFGYGYDYRYVGAGGNSGQGDKHENGSHFKLEVPTVRADGFEISPSEFELSGNNSEELKILVKFYGSKPGRCRHEFLVLSDDGVTRPFVLSAVCTSPGLELVTSTLQFDSLTSITSSVPSMKSASLLSNLGALEMEKFAALISDGFEDLQDQGQHHSAISRIVNGIRETASVCTTDYNFGGLFIGDAKQQTLCLYNPTLLPIRFTWQTESPHFSVQPSTGTLDPLQVAEFVIHFAPSAEFFDANMDAMPLNSIARLFMSGLPTSQFSSTIPFFSNATLTGQDNKSSPNSKLSLKRRTEGFVDYASYEARNLPLAALVEVTLSGTLLRPRLDAVDSVISLPDTFPGDSVMVTTELKNPKKSPLYFAFNNPSQIVDPSHVTDVNLGGSFFTVTPVEGEVAPESSVIVIFTFVGRLPGNFRALFEYTIYSPASHKEFENNSKCSAFLQDKAVVGFSEIAVYSRVTLPLISMTSVPNVLASSSFPALDVHFTPTRSTINKDESAMIQQKNSKYFTAGTLALGHTRTNDVIQVSLTLGVDPLTLLSHKNSPSHHSHPLNFVRWVAVELPPVECTGSTSKTLEIADLLESILRAEDNVNLLEQCFHDQPRALDQLIRFQPHKFGSFPPGEVEGSVSLQVPIPPIERPHASTVVILPVPVLPRRSTSHESSVLNVEGESSTAAVSQDDNLFDDIVASVSFLRGLESSLLPVPILLHIHGESHYPRVQIDPLERHIGVVFGAEPVKTTIRVRNCGPVVAEFALRHLRRRVVLSDLDLHPPSNPQHGTLSGSLLEDEELEQEAEITFFGVPGFTVPLIELPGNSSSRKATSGINSVKDGSATVSLNYRIQPGQEVDIPVIITPRSVLGNDRLLVGIDVTGVPSTEDDPIVVGGCEIAMTVEPATAAFGLFSSTSQCIDANSLKVEPEETRAKYKKWREEWGVADQDDNLGSIADIEGVERQSPVVDARAFIDQAEARNLLPSEIPTLVFGSETSCLPIDTALNAEVAGLVLRVCNVSPRPAEFSFRSPHLVSAPAPWPHEFARARALERGALTPVGTGPAAVRAVSRARLASIARANNTAAAIIMSINNPLNPVSTSINAITRRNSSSGGSDDIEEVVFGPESSPIMEPHFLEETDRAANAGSGFKSHAASAAAALDVFAVLRRLSHDPTLGGHRFFSIRAFPQRVMLGPFQSALVHISCSAEAPGTFRSKIWVDMNVPGATEWNRSFVGNVIASFAGSPVVLEPAQRSLRLTDCPVFSVSSSRKTCDMSSEESKEDDCPQLESHRTKVESIHLEMVPSSVLDFGDVPLPACSDQRPQVDQDCDAIDVGVAEATFSVSNTSSTHARIRFNIATASALHSTVRASLESISEKASEVDDADVKALLDLLVEDDICVSEWFTFDPPVLSLDPLSRGNVRVCVRLPPLDAPKSKAVTSLSSRALPLAPPTATARALLNCSRALITASVLLSQHPLDPTADPVSQQDSLSKFCTAAPRSISLSRETSSRSDDSLSSPTLQPPSLSQTELLSRSLVGIEDLQETGRLSELDLGTDVHTVEESDSDLNFVPDFVLIPHALDFIVRAFPVRAHLSAVSSDVLVTQPTPSVDFAVHVSALSTQYLMNTPHSTDVQSDRIRRSFRFVNPSQSAVMRIAVDVSGPFMLRAPLGTKEAIENGLRSRIALAASAHAKPVLLRTQVPLLTNPISRFGRGGAIEVPGSEEAIQFLEKYEEEQQFPIAVGPLEFVEFIVEFDPQTFKSQKAKAASAAFDGASMSAIAMATSTFTATGVVSPALLGDISSKDFFLNIYYSVGGVQSVPLKLRVDRPSLQLSQDIVLFPPVVVKKKKTLSISLGNTSSDAEARWTVSHIPNSINFSTLMESKVGRELLAGLNGPDKSSYATWTLQNADEVLAADGPISHLKLSDFTDDPTVFAFSSLRGIVAPSTRVLATANTKDSSPIPVIHMQFSPKGEEDNVAYCSLFRFSVENGDSVDLILIGICPPL